MHAKINSLIEDIGRGTTRKEAANILGINTSGAWATKGTLAAAEMIHGKDSEY